MSTPLLRLTPALDPERMATDHDYWFDHAEEDLAAAEERRLRRAFRQIEEMTYDRRHAA